MFVTKHDAEELKKGRFHTEGNTKRLVEYLKVFSALESTYIDLLFPIYTRRLLAKLTSLLLFYLRKWNLKVSQGLFHLNATKKSETTMRERPEEFPKEVPRLTMIK